ncbi:hypothetical protein F4678DRAFT_457417 [Xylaria arbuscula]|nr:hypothetical protein F4678DRAFT_457417 [Xylaria arbuscula]
MDRQFFETHDEVDRVLNEIFGPETHESTTLVENQEAAALAARKDEEEQTAKTPVPAKRNVRFAENLPRRRNSSEHTVRLIARSPGVPQVRNQEVPREKSDDANEAELCGETATNNNDNGNSSDNDNDGDHSDGEEQSDNDVTFEPHPLQDYPCLDESTFLSKRKVKRPTRPRKSLLTKQLRLNDEVLAEDPKLEAAVQKILKDQAKSSRRVIRKHQRLELKGKKTAIPVYMGEGPADRWDFEPTATF